MKYLVTGGLGVVGSRFVEIVCGAGHQVAIVDAAEERRNLWMLDNLVRQFGDKVEVHINRLEKMDMKPLLESCDAMLHAAAHTGIPHSSQDPNDDWLSNVDATRNILECMRITKSKIPTVMLSSVKPYKVDNIPYHSYEDKTVWGDEFKSGVDENWLLEPDEPYAASKMAQSALVMAYARTYDLPVTVLRCSNLYGDAPCHGPRHGWLTWFCISAALGWEIELQGTGLQTRDMLFSDDVASATLAAINNMSTVKGNVYNIGGGPWNQVSCLEAFRALEHFTGKTLPSRRGPGRQNEDMLFVTNHSKFTGATGWMPQIGVSTGMKRILSWAEDNKEILHDLYSEYL